MFTARALKQKNIVEYLLYMWQVEDLIRAAGGDIGTIARKVIALYRPTPGQEKELTRWYGELADMMRSESVMQSGHLQICKNVIIQLTDLHLQLLRSPKHPAYAAAYYRALPFIVELRAKSPSPAGETPELETCFQALYGIILLRMQQKEITPGTRQAAEIIAALLDQLAGYYRKDREGTLEID